MLNHLTLEKLYQLRLNGMAKAFKEQMEQPEADGLPFTERLALLVDREATERESRHLKIRLRHARLQMNACIEDIESHGLPPVELEDEKAALGHAIEREGSGAIPGA